MGDYYLNLKAEKQNTYDAIVIGSGISGGWAAKELTQKGLKVLMLERGGDYKHIKDYKDISAFDLPHRGKVPTALNDKIKGDIVTWMLSEQVAESWVEEDEGTYTEVKPFKWIRAYRLGGRSTMWGRQSYRWSDLDYEANAKDGIAIDWPIRYKDMAPWYDHVETFAGISGSLEGIPHLPDGKFQPPMPLNFMEKIAKKGIEAKYPNRKLIIGRVANLTAPLEGRMNCQFRARCWEGCHFGGYFSTQSSTLPAAAATNNLTVGVNALVTKILYDKDTKKATGVEVIDTTDNKTYEFKSKIVFVCASALNSIWILKNSATDVWADGLGSSSNELGHNIMDHHYNLHTEGVIDGYEDIGEYGKRPTGFYVPRFANVGNDKRDYLRGFGYQGTAQRQGWGRGDGLAGVGQDFVDNIATPGPWQLHMNGFGEVLPNHDNKVFLDKTVKDKFGLPVLSMDCEMKENELAMRGDILNEAKNMLEAAGFKNIKMVNGGHDIGHGIHEMGGARMGRDAKTSVLNANNQVWDAPNVFVTDGACMTSSSCVNPSLTYMAMTARAANYAVEQLKKNNL
jgi:choline dehydrogenase-like flavoprotein